MLLPNDKLGNEGPSITSFKPLQTEQRPHNEINANKDQELNPIGPINTKLELINTIEGDNGAVNEEENSVSSIQMGFSEDEKSNKETLKLDEKGNTVLMEFEEGTISRDRKKMDIKFEDSLSSVVAQSRDKDSSSFDIAF